MLLLASLLLVPLLLLAWCTFVLENKHIKLLGYQGWINVSSINHQTVRYQAGLLDDY
jgi:hypothetical protein